MYNFLSLGKCNLASAEDGSKIVNLAEMAIAMGQGGISGGLKEYWSPGPAAMLVKASYIHCE